MADTRERLRRFRITLRLTADERDRLASAASRAGLCLSAYLRFLCLGAKPPRSGRRPRIEAALLAELLACLGGIATDLHQIARGQQVEPGMERELLKALASLRELRALILHALGRKAPA